MAEFVKGDVVVVPFPFSDLTQAKRRPALVIANLAGDDLILCQITSQRIADRYAITLENSDFSEGGLNQTSNIRPLAKVLFINLLDGQDARPTRKITLVEWASCPS
ncbi:type II toxin-antitoxin system PemK/MazF family toxin [Microcoleus sp. C2C3]|uniref:type II toxin-antitoxin system PemK/MazF family toxin n=1 Tax=unclassified Microcoleus TaxID=2642155 RepID=UPI002FD014CF